MDPEELKKLLDSLNRGFDTMKAKVDEHEAAIRGGRGDDVVRREEIDRINASVGDYQKTMDQLAREMNALRIGGTGTGGERVNPEAAAHKTAFAAWMRKGSGEAELNGLAVKAALQTQVDADGGFVMPTTMEAGITRVATTRSVVRSLARVINISTKDYERLVSQGGAGGGWTTESGSRSETAAPTLSKLSFPTHEMYAEPAATQTALDDASMNLEAWLSDEVGVTFGALEGASWVSGSGVGQPRGFTSYTNIANASYAWGKVGYVASGAASTFHATLPGDNIIDLQMALKAQYRVNGTYLMADSTAGAVRKFKDGDGNYLWQPSFQLGQPQVLAGKPMETDDNMAAVGSDAYAVAFADWQQAYLIIDRVGIRVLRDPYTSKPNVLFYTTKRVGGGIQNFEAIKLLKIASS